MKINRLLAIAVIVLGVGALVFGGTFVGLGVARNNQLVDAMRVEQVTLGIDAEPEEEVIDTLSEAEAAGDTIREHRRGIADTYGDLLQGERYDPDNPDHLTYAQALNLENYLYLAVVAFGLTQSVMASGGFMIIVGLALIGTGGLLYRLTARSP